MSDIISALGAMNLGVNLSSELLKTTYYGNTVYSYLVFAGVIVLGLILGMIFKPIFKKTLKKFTKKTKNNVDDLVYYVLDKPFLFSFFTVAYLIGETSLSPASAVGGMLNNVGSVLLGVLVGWYAIRLVDSSVLFYIEPLSKGKNSRVDGKIIPVLSKTAKYTIIVLDLLFVLGNIGFDVTSLIAGLGVGGIALAMASQEALSNLFGGVAMFSDRSFQIGDILKVDKYTGNVKEIGLRSTRIKTYDGTIVTIPNKVMSNDIIENISAGKGRRIVINLGLDYNTTPKNMKIAKEILMKIAKGTKGVDHERITTAFTEFGDFSLGITFIYFMMDTSRYFGIIDEINSKILKEFNRAKIKFAYPTYTVYEKKSK